MRSVPVLGRQAKKARRILADLSGYLAKPNQRHWWSGNNYDKSFVTSVIKYNTKHLLHGTARGHLRGGSPRPCHPSTTVSPSPGGECFRKLRLRSTPGHPSRPLSPFGCVADRKVFAPVCEYVFPFRASRARCCEQSSGW